MFIGDDDDESILNLLRAVKSVAGGDSIKKEKYYNVQCLAVIVWALSSNWRLNAIYIRRRIIMLFVFVLKIFKLW